MNQPQACAAQLEKTIRVLCDDIGCRKAGTPQEAQAAAYLADQYRALGLETEIQEIPCIGWDCAQAGLQVKQGRRWREVPVQPNTQSPATPGVIEGELVYLETAHPWDLAGVDLTGKIGLLFGSAYASLERMARLCNSGLAALLYVDDRFPTYENVASGLIAGWIDHLSLPTATIPFLHAWDLVKSGVKDVQLRLDMRNYLSHSQNVVAVLPGRKPKLAPLAVGGHHDSVATNVGAEDDGSGVTSTLELARLFVSQRPLRTIKFCSFGWEENLSEGSRQYVANPANQAEKTAMMLNIDSIGGWMGNDHVYVTGGAQMRAWLKRHLTQQRFVCGINPEVSPFSDQYPFNLVGVPSLWFYRTNFPGGRWYHHAKGDTPEVLNFAHLARTVDLLAALLGDLAQSAELPFSREIPSAQQKAIVAFRKQYFDPIGDWRTRDLLRPAGVRRSDIEGL